MAKLGIISAEKIEIVVILSEKFHNSRIMHMQSNMQTVYQYLGCIHPLLSCCNYCTHYDISNITVSNYIYIIHKTTYNLSCMPYEFTLYA